MPQNRAEAQRSMTRVQIHPPTEPAAGPERDLRAAWTEDVLAVARECRWPRLLLLLGVMHLLFSLGLQTLLWLTGGLPHWPYPVVWTIEVAATIGLSRWVSGPRWWTRTAMSRVVVRVWVTYLILAFSVSTQNDLTGWEIAWFKPAWCTLGTFGFATMAWLFTPWFLVPAVQMWLTGLLTIRFPETSYLIHGLSWMLAMGVVSYHLGRAVAPAADQGIGLTPRRPA
jgi:hypothetical protein